MRKLNTSSETRRAERNKAAIEALSILKCWADSDSDTDPVIKSKIMELAAIIDVEKPLDPKDWRLLIPTKAKCLKWLIENVDFLMQGHEEIRITVKELAGWMKYHTCLQAMKSSIGESFEAKDGSIYSIVAQCRFDPDDENGGALMRYWWGKEEYAKSWKSGMDISSAALEYNEKRGYYDDEFVRIRKHESIPTTYAHWTMETLSHAEMRAKMSGKLVSGAKKFFQMQAASQSISDYINQTKEKTA